MQIEYITSIDSTNSELMRRAARGDYRTVSLVAKEQTAGRGRLGRAWLSDEHSLMLSVGLPLAPLDWSGLSLAVGLSIAESLHASIQIKWPNDLWLEGKKLAGILIETCAMQEETGRFVVVGVGINLKAPRADTFTMKTPPCGLRDVLPDVTVASVQTLILDPLLQTLRHFEQHGWRPYRERFAARDALRGKRIALSSTDATVASGQYAGVDASGALQIQTADGLKSFISHEVSVCF
jgi:BirA family transcriptional regulator, biotin operon repressor / biotin---[acetyl-CoA-carboxylase] ligase